MIKTIWVVLPDYEREGFGEPLAAFTTRRKAEAWLQRYEQQPSTLKDGQSREYVRVDLNPIRK